MRPAFEHADAFKKAAIPIGASKLVAVLPEGTTLQVFKERRKASYHAEWRKRWLVG